MIMTMYLVSLTRTTLLLPRNQQAQPPCESRSSDTEGPAPRVTGAHSLLTALARDLRYLQSPVTGGREHVASILAAAAAESAGEDVAAAAAANRQAAKQYSNHSRYMTSRLLRFEAILGNAAAGSDGGG